MGGGRPVCVLCVAVAFSSRSSGECAGVCDVCVIVLGVGVQSANMQRHLFEKIQADCWD